MLIKSQSKENILICGNTGSGKSWQTSFIIKELLSLGYSIALFCNRGEDSYQIKDSRLIKFEIVCYQKYDFSLIEKLPDVIVIDEVCLASPSSIDILIFLLQTRPGIKFILITQDLPKNIACVLPYIERVFIGKIHALQKMRLQKLLYIDSEKLNECLQKDDYDFSDFPFKIKNFSSRN